MEEFPSGQREQTVNLSALPSVVRIHPLPPKQRSSDILLLFFYSLRTTEALRCRPMPNEVDAGRFVASNCTESTLFHQNSGVVTYCFFFFAHYEPPKPFAVGPCLTRSTLAGLLQATAPNPPSSTKTVE